MTAHAAADLTAASAADLTAASAAAALLLLLLLPPPLTVMHVLGSSLLARAVMKEER